MSDLDPRLNAYRADLADLRLEGQVEAERFVVGASARITVPVASLHRKPDHQSGVDTQALFGDEVIVFERERGWAWIQSAFDGYVGYVDETSLAMAQQNPTHMVTVPRTFAYPHAELKAPNLMALSMGSALTVTGFEEVRGTQYATLATGGNVISRHIRPFEEVSPDYVAICETLVGTPYLWGGTSAFGLDCSGLVQIAMRMTGQTAPRDTDMQAAELGSKIDPGDGFERGDLVFWQGHVAVLRDHENIIHASGHTMLTSYEPLAEAIERIGYLYGEPTGYRRPL